MGNFKNQVVDISAYIERQGYACSIKADHIVVGDPVQVSWGGGRRTEYKDVKIRTWEEAVGFISVRS